MGVGLQGVALFLRSVDGSFLLIRKIVPVLDAVVQVGDQVVGRLAGPYGEFHGIDPAVLQLAGFAQVPGHAVGIAVGRARCARIVIAGGALRPLGLRSAGRFDVVLEAACLAGRNVGADVGKGRDTVVHGDAAGAQVVHDRLGDVLERFFDRARRSTVDEVLIRAVRVRDQLLQVAVAGIVAVAAVDAVEFAFRAQQVCPVGCPAVCRRVVAGARCACPGAGAVVVGGIAVRVAVRYEHHIGGVILQVIAGGDFFRHDLIAAAQGCLPAGTEIIDVVRTRQSVRVALHGALGRRPVQAELESVDAGGVVVISVPAVAEVDRPEVDQVRIRIQRIDQRRQRGLGRLHAGAAAGHAVAHALCDVHDDDDVGADLGGGVVGLAFDIQTDRIGAVTVVRDCLVRLGRQDVRGGRGRRRVRIRFGILRVVHVDVAAVRRRRCAGFLQLHRPAVGIVEHRGLQVLELLRVLRQSVVGADEVVLLRVDDDVDVHAGGGGVDGGRGGQLFKTVLRIDAPVDREGLLGLAVHPGDDVRGEILHLELGLDGLHLGAVRVDGQLAFGLIGRIGNVYDSILGDMGNRHAVGIDRVGVQLGEGALVDRHLDGDGAIGLDFLAGGSAHEGDVEGHHAVKGLAFVHQGRFRVLVFIRTGFQGLDHELDFLVKGVLSGCHGDRHLCQVCGIEHRLYFRCFRLFSLGLFRFLGLGLLRFLSLGLFRFLGLGLLGLFCLGLLGFLGFGLLRFLSLGLLGFLSFGVRRLFGLGILRFFGLLRLLYSGLFCLRVRLGSLFDCVFARYDDSGRLCLRGFRRLCFGGLRRLFLCLRQRRLLGLFLFGRVEILSYTGFCYIFLQCLGDLLCDLFH